jgi:hypothetical protein
VDGSKGYYPPTGAILHYVNGTWRLAKTLPNMEPRTISMGSATDGWAGGDLVSLSQTGKMGPNQSPVQSDTPTLWRYAGGQWIETNVPPSTNIASKGSVASIAMSSATQGWMSVYRENGAQSQDQPASIGPDLFYLEQGRWVQVHTPAVQQRRYVNILQIAFLSPHEFWGVGSANWWTGIPSDMGSGYTPTATPLIVHYKDGVWTVVEK